MKKILSLFLCLIIAVSAADELADKQKELEELNLQIEALNKLLQSNQSEKKDKQAAIDQMQKKRNELEERICQLDEEKCQAKEEWDETKEKLANTSKDLSKKKQTVQELYNSAHELSEALIVSHYSLLLNNTADSATLSAAFKTADKTLQNINADVTFLEQERKKLESKEKRDSTHFVNVQWTKIVSNKKKKDVQKQISSLDKEVSTIDKELQAALKRKEELESAQKEMNELITRLHKPSDPLRPEYSYKFSTPKLIWPLKGKIIRKYGKFSGATNKVSLNNAGIDIAVDAGTEICCVDRGIVAYSGKLSSYYGKVVIIDHQNGFFTVYSHNSHNNVSLGDRVERGTVLALSGDSGSTRQPCLHFEIRKNGKAEDPLIYLEQE